MYAVIPVFEKIFVFILVLGPLIFVHELGHFLFAKLFGVRVLKFSLGFGNKIFARKWGETEYIISSLPLGGYVKMFGEDQGDEEIKAEEAERSFSHKPVWQRFLIVAGGPLFNLLFAFFLLWFIFVAKGMPGLVDTTAIGEVSTGSAAETAGLAADDVILSINGKSTTSWLNVSDYIKESGGEELLLVVKRGEEQIKLTATPTMELVESKDIFGQVVKEEKRYLLGIMRKQIVRYERIGPLSAGYAALKGTFESSKLIYQVIVKLFQRVIPADQIGGPLSIAQMADQQMKRGFFDLLSLVVMLSVNLGILNLLPIPILDGGHLVFFTIEGIMGRPLDDRLMAISQRVGIALLGTLMLFAFYNDIVRIMRQWAGTP